MYKILGISKRRSGNYQGRDWANYLLFAANYDATQIDSGVWVDQIKVSDKRGVGDLKVGDEINVYYNRFGGVDLIQKVN